MSNNIKRITIFAAATLFSLSPALAVAGHVSAESSPDSVQSRKAHEHHPGKDGSFRAGGHFIFTETARLLNMEPTELVKSLKAGKTLSGLALEKKGWTEDQYIQKLSDAAGQKLDQTITDGRLNEDEIKKLKAALPALLKLQLRNVRPFHDGKSSEKHSAPFN